MKLTTIAAALVAAIALPAQAALITDASAFINPAPVVDFEAFDGLVTGGPESIAPGVSFRGGDGAELGAYIRDLGDNGVWGVGNHFVASGTDGALHFTFDTLQSGVGGLLSHFGGQGITITAYGSNGAVLESHGWTFNSTWDSYNAGAFIGISRGLADIRSVSVVGTGVVLDNLTHTAAVPEPESWALALVGMGLLAAMKGRRKV